MSNLCCLVPRRENSPPCTNHMAFFWGNRTKKQLPPLASIWKFFFFFFEREVLVYLLFWLPVSCAFFFFFSCFLIFISPFSFTDSRWKAQGTRSGKMIFVILLALLSAALAKSNGGKWMMHELWNMLFFFLFFFPSRHPFV